MRTLRALRQSAPVLLVPGEREPMIITIDDDTRIEAIDGLNFKVKRRTITRDINPKTGKPTKNAGEVQWVTDGYYGSLTGAALKVLQAKFASGDRELDVRRLIVELRESSERIAKACNLVPDQFKTRVLPDDLPELQALIARATDEESKRRKSV